MHNRVIDRIASIGRPAMLALALILLAMACTSEEENGAGENATGKLKVVSTVSPITSLAENIGGTRIDLEGIVPEGVNSHTFEPAPSVAAVLSDADLFIANGLFLEEPSIEMARANMKDGAVIVTLADHAVSREEWVFDFSFPSEDGHPNPHLWTSPPLALRYAELIRDELTALDPDNALLLQREPGGAEGAHQRPGPENCRGRCHRTAGEPEAADLPRLLPLLRTEVRL